MKNIDNPSEKIIIALDGMDKDDVVNLLKKIPEIVWVKVGLELFVSEGPDVLSRLRDKGKKILDPNLEFDTPGDLIGKILQVGKKKFLRVSNG